LGADAFPWGELRYSHTQALRAELSRRFAPSTANKHLAALRGVLREAWRLGHCSAEELERAVDLEPVPGTTLPAGRELSTGELRALFESCAQEAQEGGSPAAARDAALLGLLFGGGLRRAEAVALLLSDYRSEGGELTVRAGKGRKARVVYLPKGGRSALEAWLSVRGEDAGPLLCPVRKGGRLLLGPMTDQAVLYILRRRARRAGVASFTPHDMRRTFVSHLLDAGADLVAVQKLAGHSDVSTTARYDRRGEASKKRAAELLHVPFAG
jgi:site-specific recombinase XerD